jgi:hypothetical protein
MLNILQRNLLTFAIEDAERRNNYLDCDFIAEQIKELKALRDEDEQADFIQALDHLHTLEAGITYRTAQNNFKFFIDEFEASNNEKTLYLNKNNK